jgi:hypothetical protein
MEQSYQLPDYFTEYLCRTVSAAEVIVTIAVLKLFIMVLFNDSKTLIKETVHSIGISRLLYSKINDT